MGGKDCRDVYGRVFPVYFPSLLKGGKAFRDRYSKHESIRVIDIPYCRKCSDMYGRVLGILTLFRRVSRRLEFDGAWFEREVARRLRHLARQCPHLLGVVAGAQTFSKVSALVHLLYEGTVERTIEKVCLKGGGGVLLTAYYK